MLYLREINRGAFLKGGSLRGFPLSGEKGTKQWYDPNLQLSGKGNQMGSGFPKRRMTTTHASRRVLTLHLKTCSLFTLFTTLIQAPGTVEVVQDGALVANCPPLGGRKHGNAL